MTGNIYANDINIMPHMYFKYAQKIPISIHLQKGNIFSYGCYYYRNKTSQLLIQKTEQ